MDHRGKKGGWSVCRRTDTGFVFIESVVIGRNTAVKLAKVSGVGVYRLGRSDGSKSITIRVRADGTVRYGRIRRNVVAA